MPLVRVWYNSDTFKEVDMLRIACMEMVPAVLNTAQGQLTPGSIEFFAKAAERGDYLSTDVVIDVEAMYYDDRDAQAHSDAIRHWLNMLIPGPTYAVWVKLVNAGWASDEEDPRSDADMYVGAAYKRAQKCISDITPAYVRQAATSQDD
jgi:hypothetical protein